MAKGKKTIIKDIKRISEDVISINGAEYIIIEDEKDIETAITMKITSQEIEYYDLKILKKWQLSIEKEISK